jgi:RHH-type proline utilization regulon transcriptional repressor/proline dehydrogenase/delta 1-pyrroline-5-carboxylate dehydrogenase
MSAVLARARELARRLLKRCARPLLDIQRVFAWLPPERPAGEALLRLVEALSRTPDRGGRKALAREYLPGVPLALAEFGARFVARQFVFAETIGEALARAGDGRYSFDMLGEGARTAADAERGMQRYLEALAIVRRGGISVKLSSIHERFDAASYPRVRGELLDRLRLLCERAAAAGVALTIDAEESERSALQLDLFAQLAALPALRDWPGLGLAVQAYRRALPQTLEAVFAASRGRAPLAVRLVKGAYWDAEVKRAQELGLAEYPVHIEKAETDRAYVAAAARLLEHAESIYPQFATHNPVTAACVLALAGGQRFEFQRLHGMGEALERALAAEAPEVPVRVYAPVGARSELLAYLVRRLLENGASTSFVRQAARARNAERLIEEAFARLKTLKSGGGLPNPTELHMPERRVARGYDLGEPSALAEMAKRVAQARRPWRAAPLVNGVPVEGPGRSAVSPARPEEAIATVVDASAAQVREAIGFAHAARERWAQTPAAARAAALERLADLMESHVHGLMALCVWEAGKTLPDALADVREAVDFCRYYAAEVRRLMGAPLTLKSPVGETNALSLHARGVFACISPWNFPVAIFTGQVAAALAAGNTVVAKPAEQAPLVAYRVAQLALEAGIPPDVLQLLPGDGAIGQALVADARIAGVAFTGSVDTARAIQRTLVQRDGPIVPLIAETGGLNAMIVDSTALPEQVVDAVVASAFRSAGQRCSSLRMLYLQEEVAPAVLEMLRGATAALRLGDPADPSTDIGPVIDAEAKRTLDEYVVGLRRRGAPLAEAGPLPRQGHFVAPVAFAVNSIRDLPGERFGPVLHVARFAIERLDAVIDDINAMGYGLTLGVHTRIDSRAEHIRRRARVGNLYVNRNMIGAVVGVQPFGGEGLSGTGPKAGGPYTLPRFATERVYTVNTAAAGGDLRLLAGEMSVS